MVSSSRRVWVGSVALSGVLLLSSLPGVLSPVKAAEQSTSLDSLLRRSPSQFTAIKARNKLIVSAAVPVNQDKLTQVVAEVKKPEIIAEKKTETNVAAKPASTAKTPQKPTPVASETSQVSRGGTSKGSEIIKNAQSLLGVPYLFGGTTRKGFDCSGFVQYVYKGSGISLPRDSFSQFKVGNAVKKDELQPGDLVFFTTYSKGASHVGIYIGGGQFIHAADSGVQITSLSNSYYSARYVGARRV
jgi:peptidoglycan DL-endopeptidase CwlO